MGRVEEEGGEEEEQVQEDDEGKGVGVGQIGLLRSRRRCGLGERCLDCGQ